MKLKKVYKNIIERLEPFKDYLPDIALEIKNDGVYKDYEVRLAWDILRLVCTHWEICKWYDVYKCNDSHITTLGKKVCKHFNLI